jgi:predicted Zn-dependent protease
LQDLKLSDDEVAVVMGHEMAHALREHARERMGKSAATGIGASLLSQLLGLGELGQTVTRYGAQLLTLKFGREDETEADLVGMELAAKAGFNPRAGVTLWKKMDASNQGSPPEWLSTHPSGSARIAQIEANLPQVMPFYERARKVRR